MASGLAILFIFIPIIFEENKNKLSLSLHTRISTDSAGIAKSLGLNAESKVELRDLIRILEPKLTAANRLKIL